jgi:hypothetical protein
MGGGVLIVGMIRVMVLSKGWGVGWETALGRGGVTARPVCGPPGFPRSALSLKARCCLKTSVGASLLRPGSHPTTPQCSVDSNRKVPNLVVTGRMGLP